MEAAHLLEARMAADIRKRNARRADPEYPLLDEEEEEEDRERKKKRSKSKRKSKKRSRSDSSSSDSSSSSSDSDSSDSDSSSDDERRKRRRKKDKKRKEDKKKVRPSHRPPANDRPVETPSLIGWKYTGLKAHLTCGRLCRSPRSPRRAAGRRRSGPRST